MRVLVLDGNENQAVAATRSLARCGHDVWVGADTGWSKAGWSRACAARFRYPSPGSDPAAFVTAIEEQAGRAAGTLVLPMTEPTTLALSAHRHRVIGAGGCLVLPPHDVVERAFDKAETTALAQRLGITVPRTVLIASDDDAHRHASTIRFPVVVKPRSSQEYRGGTLRTTGAPCYACNAEGLLSTWRDLSQRCEAALVQEFVDGAGVGYFALMRDGELRAEFAHRRLRDVRPTGSGSSLRVSIDPPPRVRDAAHSILTALRWHGVAMVEFRVTSAGTPIFLEVNGRFWNSLALPIAAGIDFPAMLAALAIDGDVAPAGAYRAGVRCRWLLGDIRHLVDVWRGAPAGYPRRFPSRARTTVDVLAPVSGTVHDNFRWGDPLPEAGDWLHFALRKLPRRLKNRPSEVWHAAGRPSHP